MQYLRLPSLVLAFVALACSDGATPSDSDSNTDGEGDKPDAGSGTTTGDAATAADACKGNPCGAGTCKVTGDSYECSCPDGFAGERACTDVDECESGTPCGPSGRCVNDPGSYHCDCSAGFEGSKSCNDVDECADSPCGPGECKNVEGSYECTCPSGYEGLNCTDVDECLSTECIYGDCVNTDGAYYCECQPGFVGFDQGRGCIDLDECSVGTPCGAGTCVNDFASYHCECPAGFTGTKSCDDVDECAQASACDPKATCTNSTGSYSCACESPYLGDGHECSRKAVQVDVNYAHACAVLDNGAVRCWGDSSYGKVPSEQPVRMGTGRTATQVATGFHHTCVVLDNGQVKCWGYNEQGQLGTGDTSDRSFPAQMGDALREISLEGASSALAVATSLGTLVLRDDGHVLGLSSSGDIEIDVDAEQITMGVRHWCALLSSGDVYCEGAIAELAAGIVDIGSGRKALAVSAGDWHTCALRDDGSVVCWGNNWYGQLGVGHESDIHSAEEMGDALQPVALGANRTAIAIDAGGAHTCVILDNQSVKCWGMNNQGQLGIGDTFERGSQPSQMGDALPAVSLGVGRHAIQIAVGGSRNLESGNTCVVLDNGQVKCWGGGTGTSPEHMGDALRPIYLQANDLPVSCPCDKYPCSVQTNEELEELTGCEELRELYIAGPAVTNLAPLSSVKWIRGPLGVIQTGLTTLAGLDGLLALDGYLELNGNPNLSSLAALSGVRQLPRNRANLNPTELLITDNAVLSSLDGLHSLTRVEGRVTILDNPGLQTLDGLRALTSVRDQVTIRGNDSLTSVQALEHVAVESIMSQSSFSITDNQSLPTCNAVTAANAAMMISPSNLRANICNNAADTCGSCVSLP